MDRNASDFIQYLGNEFGRSRFPQEAYDRLNAQRSKGTNRCLSLARADDLTPASVAQVIRRGTGDKIERVVMVSSSRVPADGVLTVEEIRRIRSGLKIGEGLADRLSRCHEHAIKAELTETRRQELRRRLNDYLGDGLWSAFGSSFPDGSWLKAMRAALYDNLWYATFFYFASLAAGLNERAERLRDLSRLVGCALPLCRRGDESNEWILIVR